MRPVAATATLLATLWLGAPSLASAQDPEPAPAPPAPRQVAVPRSERIRTREAEPAAAASPQEERRGAVRAVERPAPEPRSASEGGQTRRTEPASGEGGARRAVRAEAASAASEVDDEQRSGQRRGAVRRPAPTRGESAGGARTRDRAVPRTSAPRHTGRVYVYPDYYRNYNRYYDPWGYGGFGLGYFYYSPWGWDPGYYGTGYGRGSGYGYNRYSASGYDIGTVKLKVRPRDAEVYVDNYFAGQVDDFDGMFQALKLDTGGHRIEIRKPGFEVLRFDVHVQPERSVTFRGEMKPIP